MKTRRERSNARELAVEAGNDLADGLGSTSGRRDDVPVNTTTATPVLHGRSIDGLLGSSGGVDGAHQALNDAVLVVDDFGKGGEAVGRAGRVGDLWE